MSTTPLKKVTPETVTLSENPPLAADGNEAKPASEPGAKAGPAVDVKPKPKKPKPKPANPAALVEAPKASVVAQVKPKAGKPAPDAGNPEGRPSKVPGLQAAPVVALPTNEPVRDAAAAVRALRRARARRLGLRVAIGIGLPAVVASIYFFLVASSQYESVSLFTVNSADAGGVMGLETLLGAVPGAPATRDTLAVRDFITSRDMLALLDHQLKVHKHYKDPARDWWARLSSGSSSEGAYDYYRDKVQVDHDSSSGVLTLRVKAFSPEFAKQVSATVLSESEKMVNHLSEKARADQTKLARTEVASAEARLTKARHAIVALQQEHAEFNPEQSATEAFALRGELKGELARARAELMEARAFMQPNAPRVVAIQERVRSLSAQVSEESRRLVNPKSDKGLGNAMAAFDAAMVEKEFAQSAYQSALTSLELARSEAVRQHRYLAMIAKPSVPSDETHPKRVRGVITVVLLSAMVLGMVMLLVEAIREHARI